MTTGNVNLGPCFGVDGGVTSFVAFVIVLILKLLKQIPLSGFIENNFTFYTGNFCLCLLQNTNFAVAFFAKEKIFHLQLRLQVHTSTTICF